MNYWRISPTFSVSWSSTSSTSATNPVMPEVSTHAARPARCSGGWATRREWLCVRGIGRLQQAADKVRQAITGKLCARSKR